MRPELQDVVDEAARLLGVPVTLEDRDFQLVAFAAHSGPVDAVRHASILRRRSSARVRAHFEGFGIAAATGPVHVPGAGSGRTRIAPRLCLPARSRGVTYGYLWAIEDADPVDHDRAAAAMRLADRAGLLLAQQARARDDVAWLLDDLLSSDAEAAGRAADELDARGLAGRGVPHAVVVVRAGSPPVALWGLPRAVLVLPGEDGLTLLVPSAGPGTPGRTVLEVARQAVELLRGQAAEDVGAADDASAAEHPGSADGAAVDGASADGAAAGVRSPAEPVAGVGEVVADLADARESRRQARVAARVASAAPDGDPVVRWADLGVHRLLACGTGTLADAVLDPAVRRLLDADEPDLVRTARCWLDAGCSPARAAAELAVHRQTLYARLARIEQLTGLGLVGGDRCGQHRLRLHLALTLVPLLR